MTETATWKRVGQDSHMD